VFKLALEIVERHIPAMPFLKTLFSCPGVAELIRLKNVLIEAGTLGEAIRETERIANVRIVAHDPPKWFRVYSSSGASSEYRLVDIHILRDDQEICPKQDLSYALLSNDIVRIAGVTC
jgi:hypothetical protein